MGGASQIDTYQITRLDSHHRTPPSSALLMSAKDAVGLFFRPLLVGLEYEQVTEAAHSTRVSQVFDTSETCIYQVTPTRNASLDVDLFRFDSLFP
jgi:hypothetical protein